jgi:NAD(P)-dependent dehydrogenase (short-subunit alcohol dehydrogenase family)
MPPAPIADRHSGKIAIVTGAGQGIGRAVARRLTQEGAHVIVAEYNAANAAEAANELSSIGPEAVSYPIDIGDVEQVNKMISDVVGRFGKIDILINNAGLIDTLEMFDITPELWDRLQRVNQRGLFFCLQGVAKQMVTQVPEEVKAAKRADRSYGKIVNFSSISGRRGRAYQSHYSASKFAVISITQSAALYLAPYNINVNAVCPGIVPTPMWDGIDKAQVARFGLEKGQWFERMTENVPLKRPASGDDVAAVVSFLCSGDADYITGQAINVDGGFEMN